MAKINIQFTLFSAFYSPLIATMAAGFLKQEECISSYQHLGCWTPHVEITRSAFEVTLDVFETIGGIPERYPYELVCVAPPVKR